MRTQMVSLLHLAEITEEGVTFQSPIDGSRMLLTPEQSMAIQNRLGACTAPAGDGPAHPILCLLRHASAEDRSELGTAR